MGATWESAIFARETEFDQLAQHVSEVAKACKAPQVILHFMKATDPNRALVSAELTAFRKRRVDASSEALRQVTEDVFGNAGLAFRGPEILLAKILSERVGRCLYLSHHDSYNSAGYVLFEGGTLSSFEIVGWEGSEGVVANVESDASQSAVIARGLRLIGWKADSTAIESVFDAFYGDASETTSFLMKDRGTDVSPPQRV